MTVHGDGELAVALVDDIDRGQVRELCHQLITAIQQPADAGAVSVGRQCLAVHIGDLAGQAVQLVETVAGRSRFGLAECGQVAVGTVEGRSDVLALLEHDLSQGGVIRRVAQVIEAVPEIRQLITDTAGGQATDGFLNSLQCAEFGVQPGGDRSVVAGVCFELAIFQTTDGLDLHAGAGRSAAGEQPVDFGSPHGSEIHDPSSVARGVDVGDVLRDHLDPSTMNIEAGHGGAQAAKAAHQARPSKKWALAERLARAPLRALP